MLTSDVLFAADSLPEISPIIYRSSESQLTVWSKINQDQPLFSVPPLMQHNSLSTALVR